MKQKYKIALLGSFPISLYKEKIKFWNTKEKLVTSWNYNLAKGLASNEEFEIHFICTAPLFKTKIYNDNGLFIHFVGHPPRLDIINRITYTKYSEVILRREIKKIKPDLIHGIGTDHEYAYIATKSKYPSIITLHGIMGQIVKKIELPKFSILRLFAKLEEYTIKQAKYLISINPYVIEQFEDFNGKIFKIENAIHPIFFQEFKSKENFDISFVGIYNERKRLMNLIKAFEVVKDTNPELKLKIIGASNDIKYQQEVEEYVERNNLNESIVFLGQMKQVEMAEELAKTKLLILPSIEETAPMVIAEAMALGKPVIATDVGGIKYMIKDNITGFVIPPDDIKAIIDKIELLLNNEKLRHRMGEASRQLALSIYHPDVIVEKTISAYNYVINNYTK